MDLSPLKPKLPATVFEQLPGVISSFNITTAMQLCHFLAQCAHESITFTAVRENLNYSAAGLLKIFPKYFDDAKAAAYAHKPEKIANRVYANRMGNGEEASGDGWSYRGRGYIQLTGKVNYQAFANSIKVPDIMTTPDLVATTYPLSSAGFFFQEKKLFALANQGATDDIVKQITKIVNGGFLGLAERTAFFHTYYNLMVPPAG